MSETSTRTYYFCWHGEKRNVTSIELLFKHLNKMEGSQLQEYSWCQLGFWHYCKRIFLISLDVLTIEVVEINWKSDTNNNRFRFFEVKYCPYKIFDEWILKDLSNELDIKSWIDKKERRVDGHRILTGVASRNIFWKKKNATRCFSFAVVFF